jgi:hypothetical protein
MSFVSRMQEAARQAEALRRDPWEPRLRRALEGVEAMSSVALLDLVNADPTTSNARRLAHIMRELNFIPIKTRRFMPGGFRDTVTRGWARPVRPLPVSEKVKPQQGTPSPRSNLVTPGADDVV